MPEHIEKLREELVALGTYRSGDYYMGGMATCGAMRRMGAVYGQDGWAESVKKSSERGIGDAAEYLKSYLEYMRSNPMRVCPCCKRPF